ncbi:MAG: hypothetical protein F6J98_02265 [Moorea sp. SIO4G2]|nr:hypothetical protein [Moorena sp. SIO4G2]
MITLENLEVLEPLSDKDDVVGGMGLVFRDIKIITTLKKPQEETIPLSEQTIDLPEFKKAESAGESGEKQLDKLCNFFNRTPSVFCFHHKIQ